MAEIANVQVSQRVVETFKGELAKLPVDLAIFTAKVLDVNTPEYFWHVPASLSGKYHPRCANRVGGLVNHVRLCCWWLDRLAESEGITGRDLELCRSALLLHDIHKFEPPAEWIGPTDNATGRHGVWSAWYLERHWSGQPVKPVAELVRWHMGRWTASNEDRPDYYEHIQLCGQGHLIRMVHLADMCAAGRVDDVFKALEAGGQL